MHRFLLLIVVLSSFVSTTPVTLAREKEQLRIATLDYDNAPTEIVARKQVVATRTLADFSVTVRNTSDRPIYYIAYHLSLPETARYFDNAPVGFMLTWGDESLSYLGSAAGSPDQALLPGASLTLTLPAGKAEAYRKYMSEILKAPLAVRAELSPYSVGFGEGAGWLAGHSYDNTARYMTDEEAQRAPCAFYANGNPYLGCPCAPNPRPVYLGEPGAQRLTRNTCIINEGPPPVACYYDTAYNCFP